MLSKRGRTVLMGATSLCLGMCYWFNFCVQTSMYKGCGRLARVFCDGEP